MATPDIIRQSPTIMEKRNHLTIPADLGRPSNTIADLGELALIEKLKPFCAAGSIGDDAALMSAQPGHNLVVTTDMLTENVHFSGRTTPPYSVGWRAAAANLADIAAMGASPLGVTVGLGLPGHTPLTWVEELYRGMTDCMQAHGGAIFGGDLCRSIQRTISITAIGEVTPQQTIRRDTAVPGMTVVVTGPHGASRAGLALLLEELELTTEEHSTSPLGYAKGWIRAHQMPIPRFDALQDLRRVIELVQQKAKKRRGKSGNSASTDTAYPIISGMDSSDGLANALLQISSSSKIGMDIVRSDIVLPAGLSAAVGAETALKWALHGGEDFELVLCLPSDIAAEFTKTRFATAIGVTTDTGIVRLLPNKYSKMGSPITHQSFQHF
ncbi:MAG: thiamine-phosphate kinase, partial [Cyanobacteria bacterium J06649_4]